MFGITHQSCRCAFRRGRASTDASQGSPQETLTDCAPSIRSCCPCRRRRGPRPVRRCCSSPRCGPAPRASKREKRRNKNSCTLQNALRTTLPAASWAQSTWDRPPALGPAAIPLVLGYGRHSSTCCPPVGPAGHGPGRATTTASGSSLAATMAGRDSCRAVPGTGLRS